MRRERFPLPPGSNHARSAWFVRGADHLVGLLRWVGPRRVGTVVVGGVAVAVGGWWLLRAPAEPLERSLPRAVPAAASTSTVDTGSEVSANDEGLPQREGPHSLDGRLLVHVAGAVVRSGVVRLGAGARVQDAIAAAGGATAQADLDAVNLAELCVDGTRVYVPRFGESVSGSLPGSDRPGPTLRINLNSATETALDSLPGVGPSLARAIVAYRAGHGPFRSVDELLEVPGVGPSKLAQLSDLVSV